MNSFMRRKFLFSVSYTLILASCGQEPPPKRQPKTTIVKNKVESEDLKKDTEKIDREIPKVVKEDKNHPVKKEQADVTDDLPDNPPDDTNKEPSKKNDGEAFFSDNISRAFDEANCQSCHAPPRDAPPIQGPLTIFNYEKMRDMLEDRSLLDKLTGASPHGGGNQCEGKITLPPCSKILEWWNFEFKQTPPQDRPDAMELVGEIRNISDTGTFTGWAFDPDSPMDQVDIKIYLDGDQSTGSLGAEGAANLSGYDNDLDGEHAFQIKLTEDLIDSMEHEVRVYAMIEGDEIELRGSPTSFTAFKKSSEGENFYNSTVNPQLTTCTSCHTFDYSTHWPSLLSPSPAKGGTDTNNLLFQKVSGGTPHIGGVFCPNGSGSPCDELKEWWSIEFGTP